MSILASSGARVMEEKSNDTHNHNATHTVDHSQPVGPHTFRLHLHEAQKQNIGPGSYSLVCTQTEMRDGINQSMSGRIALCNVVDHADLSF